MPLHTREIKYPVQLTCLINIMYSNIMSRQCKVGQIFRTVVENGGFHRKQLGKTEICIFNTSKHSNARKLNSFATYQKNSIS